MTIPITHQRLGRTARAVVTATTIAGLGVGLALGIAAPAQAKQTFFNATPAQLESACSKVGGTFTSVNDAHMAECKTTSGVGQCTDDGHCVFTSARVRGSSVMPGLPLGVGAA